MAKRKSPNSNKGSYRNKSPKRSVDIRLGKGRLQYTSSDPTWDESALRSAGVRWKHAVEAAKYNRERKALFGKNPIRNYKKLAKADLRTPEHVAKMAKIHSATTLGTEAIGSIAGNYAASKAQDTQIALLRGGTSGSNYNEGAKDGDEDNTNPDGPYGNRMRG